MLTPATIEEHDLMPLTEEEVTVQLLLGTLLLHEMAPEEEDVSTIRELIYRELCLCEEDGTTSNWFCSVSDGLVEMRYQPRIDKTHPLIEVSAHCITITSVDNLSEVQALVVDYGNEVSIEFSRAKGAGVFDTDTVLLMRRMIDTAQVLSKEFAVTYEVHHSVSSILGRADPIPAVQ